MSKVVYLRNTVPCVICGKETEILWKMKHHELLRQIMPKHGIAHESGLCPDCNSGGASCLPHFDAVYEIVNLKTKEVLWKEGQKWEKRSSEVKNDKKEK